MMAEEKKKRRKKRAYLDDFYQDLSGNYVYRGKLYRYTAQDLPRKTALTRGWLCTGAALAALLVNGLVPNPALSGCFYVVIPYVAGLIAACSAAWALGRVTAAGDELRAYVYDETAAQLPARCMLSVVCSAAAAAGQLLYLILHGTGALLELMLLFVCLQLFASFGLYKLKCFKFEGRWTAQT